MPKKRYERREISHNWEDIRPLLKDSAQLTYEVIRPVVLFGVSPKERAEETGISKSSIYYKANLFDQAGMASLFPPTPPPDLPKQDKRALPPPIRQAIVDAHAEYSELSLHEIASICYVQFGRKPSPHTIQYILATGPKPERSTRRYKQFAEIDDPMERRRPILKLHFRRLNREKHCRLPANQSSNRAYHAQAMGPRAVCRTGRQITHSHRSEKG